MTDPDVVKILKNILAGERKFAQAWLADLSNEKRMYKGRFEKVLTPFLQDGHAQKKLVPRSFDNIAFWHMMHARDACLNRRERPAEQLALAALYSFWYRECAHAIMESDDPAGYNLTSRDFIPVCTMLTLGWSNHAVRMAETLFDRWDVQKDGNGAVPWETLGEYMPWISIKLYKAWRDSDADYQYEPEIEQFGGFAPLLEKLLDRARASLATPC